MSFYTQPNQYSLPTVTPPPAQPNKPTTCNQPVTNPLRHAKKQIREREPRDARSAASGERERDQGVLRERRGPAPRGVSASRGRAERREGRARVGMCGSDSPDEQASAAVRPARESCGIERRGVQCMQRSAVQATHGMDQAAAPTRS